MKLLALIEAPNHVCHRYRLAAFAPALEQRGWSIDAQPIDQGSRARAAQFKAAAQADVVVLQRRLLPFWQLRVLRKAAKVLVYDLDDALFHRDWQTTKNAVSWQRLAHFWATIYACDAVTAGNGYLHEQASQYIDPAKVFQVPTCVDPRLYPTAHHERRGADAKLVWIGQRSTMGSLYEARPCFAAAADVLPGLEMRVVCDVFPVLAPLRVAPRPWSEATEAGELAEADIGVSWLPDHPWSLGKCGLKVLQYMAAGLPVVANPLGIHRNLVRHGETGFLADDPAEWADAVQRLADDPELRRRMGQAARKLVVDQYSVDRWAPEVVGMYERWGSDRLPAVDLSALGLPTERRFDPAETPALSRAGKITLKSLTAKTLPLDTP